jgi:tRNA A-37 threonylcarbamoyl transferase component Bud32
MTADSTYLLPNIPPTITPKNARLQALLHIGSWVIVMIASIVYFAVSSPVVNQSRAIGFCQTALRIGWTADSCTGFYAAADILFLILNIEVSAVIILRRPAERISLLAGVAMVLLGSTLNFPSLQEMENSVIPSLANASNSLFNFGLAAAVLFMSRFPDGRCLPRWLFGYSLVICGLYVVGAVYFPVSVLSIPDFALGVILICASFAPAVIGQVIRFRKYATPTERQQTKWALFGFFVTIAGYAVIIIIELLLLRIGFFETALGTWVYYFLLTLHWVTLAAFPVSMLFSIFRFRLWQIDLVISRTLSVALVTLVLALIFIGLLAGVDQVTTQLALGNQSGLAMAISGFAVAIVFNPLRQRLNKWIDRHFYPKYLVKAQALDHQNQQKAMSPTPQPVNSLYGKRLGVYEVLDPIGRGGMAEVYRGCHTTLERSVAIKMLPATLALDESFRKRFEREARTVAGLRHPNIVQLYDFGVQDDLYYMVMEYIQGHSLNDHLRGHGKLAFEDAQMLLKGIAEALDFAHQQGVIHRDVKPANIMLQPITTTTPHLPTLRPILMDFGIARLIESDSGLTSTGTLGTLDYIAPEQIISSKDVDGRADLYALGVISYQMLTGVLPFVADNAGALVLAHLQRTPLDPRKLNPEIPDSAAKATLRALAKEPKDRYESASAFIAALERS